MSSIAKLCVNHLRTFSNNHGVKLKSGHAHELVAAFFGYKSKAAMLADTLSPIDSLNQAKFLVLTPPQCIEQRRKCLEDLPPDLPNNFILGETLFTCLTLDGYFSGRSFSAWKHLVDMLTTEYLLQHGGSILSINFGINEIVHSNFDKPADEYIPVPDITGNGVTLTTNMRYAENSINSRPIEIIVTIMLQRIAGHIGYANPNISVTGGSL